MIGQTIQRNVNNEQLNIFGGNEINNGGSIILAGNAVADANFQGIFQLRAAKNINTAYALVGKPDGTLEWGTYNVFNDLGGSAIVAKSLAYDGYVKRASGEILQWQGGVVLAGNTEIAMTYPISFPSACRVFVTSSGNSGIFASIKTSSITKTGCVVQINHATTSDTYFNIFAIGY